MNIVSTHCSLGKAFFDPEKKEGFSGIILDTGRISHYLVQNETEADPDESIKIHMDSGHSLIATTAVLVPLDERADTMSLKEFITSWLTCKSFTAEEKRAMNARITGKDGQGGAVTAQDIEQIIRPEITRMHMGENTPESTVNQIAFGLKKEIAKKIIAPLNADLRTSMTMDYDEIFSTFPPQLLNTLIHHYNDLPKSNENSQKSRS